MLEQRCHEKSCGSRGCGGHRGRSAAAMLIAMIVVVAVVVALLDAPRIHCGPSCGPLCSRRCWRALNFDGARATYDTAPWYNVFSCAQGKVEYVFSKPFTPRQPRTRPGHSLCTLRNWWVRGATGYRTAHLPNTRRVGFILMNRQPLESLEVTTVVFLIAVLLAIAIEAVLLCVRCKGPRSSDRMAMIARVTDSML